MLTQHDLDKIRKFATEHKEIITIYVFGSVATGKERLGSDIDLAIMVRGDIRGLQRIELETWVSNLLGRDVDITVFGQSMPLLQHQILKYGTLIYETDPLERVRQEVSARSAYMDTKFLFREIRDKVNG